MERGPRAIVAVSAAVVGFALVYAIPPFTRLPNLFYDPLARRYHVAAAPATVEMGYYGQLMYGLVGGLVFAAVTLALVRRPSHSTTALATAWALTFLALTIAYFTWVNWP